MTKVVFPLAIRHPDVVVFSFTLSMHEFIYALTSSPSRRRRPSRSACRRSWCAATSSSGGRSCRALIASLPVAVVYTFFLDRFVAGFTMGAVK